MTIQPYIESETLAEKIGRRLACDINLKKSKEPDRPIETAQGNFSYQGFGRRVHRIIQNTIIDELRSAPGYGTLPPKLPEKAALIGLYAEGERLLEFWRNGTAIYPGSVVAADFKAAMERAKEAI